MIIARVSDATWVSVNSLQFLGIIYLAIAISKLSQRISFLEGKLNGKKKGAEKGDE